MASKKADSYDAFSKTLTGVLAGIKVNLTSTRQVPVQGQSVSVGSLSTDFQDYLDKNTAADAAKASNATMLSQRKALKKATKKQLGDFSKWIVLQFGPTALALYGLPLPKVRATSPAKQAIGAEKRKAKSKAKAVAKPALVPAAETFVALDASGNPIGGARVAPAASVANVASAPESVPAASSAPSGSAAK